MSDFAAIAAVIRNRRTIKAFTGQALERDTVEGLLELARWAPNHRLSEPWRFRCLDQAAVRRLVAHLQATPAIRDFPDAAKGPAKLAKLAERITGAGAVLHVTWLRAADPAIDLEDHAAAAAAVQNLLLAAQAAGLGSFWSTNPALGHPLTGQWLGVDAAREGFLGSLWLGYAAENPEAPRRRPVGDRCTWA